MLAIFRRDFKSLFQNVIGFLFVGLMLSVFGLYFTVYNLRGASSSITHTMLGLIHISLFAIPLLTMRSLSEERKHKTDQLLLTAPVSVFKIVFGKFLALAGVFSIVVGIICLTPLILSQFGTVDYAENYVAILGFWLYGLVCISVGMFVSSFFESQILAAVVSFVALFVGYMMNGISTSLNATGMVQKVLKCYDFTTPLYNFMNGNFEVCDLIYDISIIALMIFLTCQGILKRRWSVSAKRISMTVFSSAGIVIGVALCIAINVLGTYIPKKYSTIDFTSQKLYTLTKESKEYINTLEDDIQIYVAGKKSTIDDVERKTLTNFDEASKHISVEYIDINENMKFFGKYTENDMTSGSFAVVNGDTSKVVSYSDLYVSDFDYATYSQTVSGYDGEGQLVSALQYVTQDEFTTVYLLEGHDELKLGTECTDLMKKANWKLENLNLLSVEKVPEDCAALIINSPQSDFSKDDSEKILSFVKKGGNVIITYDYLCTNKLKNFMALTEEYGISVEDGMVFDNDMSYYYQYPNVLLPNVEYSDAASSVYGSLMVMAPYSYAFKTPMFDTTITSLLTTSIKAELKDVTMENMEDKMNKAVEEAKENAEDESFSGSYYAVGLLVEPEVGGKLILYGTPYMFMDQFNEMVSGRNATLLMDNLKYMIGEEESNTSAVVIPVKNMQHEYLTVPQSALLLYGLFLGIIAPIILIVFGIIFWAIRRRR